MLKENNCISYQAFVVGVLSVGVVGVLSVWMCACVFLVCMRVHIDFVLLLRQGLAV